MFLRHPTSPEFDICFNTVILASFGLFHLLSDEGLLEPIGQNLPLRQEPPILGHLLHSFYTRFTIVEAMVQHCQVHSPPLSIY